MNEAWRDALLLALNHACSQNPSLTKEAEDKLKSWEREPGYYSLLMIIFKNKTLDVNIRWMAMVLMKNGVERYWRKSAPHSIAEEEKTFIKQNLTMSLDEPVNQVITQVAVLISKIARMGLGDWPELLPCLLKEVKSQDPLHQQRSLLVLNHVVKMLASKRLIPDKQLFRKMTLDIFGYILHLWQSKTASLLEAFQVKEYTRSLGPLELSSLALKVLRKLLVHGLKEFDPTSQAVSLLEAVLEKIKMMLHYRKSENMSCSTQEKVEKYVILLTKVLIDSQEHHPLSFLPLMQPVLELCYNYLFTSEGKACLFETFALQCCKLIKMIVKCEMYQPPREIKETTPKEILKAHQIKTAFFTPPMLSETIQQLILFYLPLTAEDLKSWELDPENFVNEEAGESWRYNLRACIEVLYLSLLSEFRSTVTQVVTEMIKLLQGSPPSDDISVLLKKDAVYNACGLSSYDLFDEIDFDQWFLTQLLQELNNSSSRYKILRRRVIWMVGQWINVKCARQTRTVLYPVLLDLMNVQEDLVVRLTAANTLKTAIDDVEFYLEDFVQFLDGSFEVLFNLLKCTNDCDTKMQVLHVLSLLIQRIGSKVQSFASPLSIYLPELWQASGDHNMLQCAIVSTMTHLVEGLGVWSEQMYPFLLPLIQLSTDVSQPSHIYLMEDGLDLWHNVLMNASCMAPELLQLFANMPPLLELGSENLRTCFAIVESYVLLDPRTFLQNCSAPVVDACLRMLGNIKPEGSIILSRVVETIIKVSPLDGPQVFAPVLLKILNMIIEVEEHTPLLVIYLCIIGEISLHNYHAFVHLVENVAQQLSIQAGNVLSQLLEIWLDKMDCMTRLERRKLTVLSLMTLLPLNVLNCVMQKFAIIVDAAVDVLHEIHRVEDGGTHTDCLVVLVGDGDDGNEHTEEQKRKRKLSLSSPVHCFPLWQFVRDKLQECRSVYGHETFQYAMDSMDSAVVTQLGTFINH